MLWAIASSVFILYLYRKLKAARTPRSGAAPAGTVEAEIAALTAQIAKLEDRIAGTGGGGAKS
ncbi:hypothetical protein ACTGJ9_034890 [Bradyrhizobium sp. RDM12]